MVCWPRLITLKTRRCRKTARTWWHQCSSSLSKWPSPDSHMRSVERASSESRCKWLCKKMIVHVRILKWSAQSSVRSRARRSSKSNEDGSGTERSCSAKSQLETMSRDDATDAVRCTVILRSVIETSGPISRSFASSASAACCIDSGHCVTARRRISTKKARTIVSYPGSCAHGTFSRWPSALPCAPAGVAWPQSGPIRRTRATHCSTNVQKQCPRLESRCRQ
mmetsp:Transcript_1540/g.5069  ORF Transcript_1540/g.5069 Transcript_1540/m.5069 type:complete len:223 (-) Transcript_1540:210-878(-)